ncbi:MAG: class I SAM-dependent methyltransferase [Proteobacteria bacterium]|nr:class I SAM-dependent methyltransferase [Pseudomonadota bacterium]
MRLSDILANPTVYQCWQTPFYRQKMSFISDEAYLRPGRVLELGCGPGTNICFFQDWDYVGLDVEPLYVEAAAKVASRICDRYRLVKGDCTQVLQLIEGPFDMVLANSLLHHLDDAQVDSTVRGASQILSSEGTLQIIDLVLDPERCALGNWLARHDRGEFPRSVGALRVPVERYFEVVKQEVFNLSLFGIPLWNMVYIAAKPRGT